MSYLAWRHNELLMATSHGLMVWTSSYFERYHLFYQLSDDKLWEWGYQ